jgi:hypothetical protein
MPENISPARRGWLRHPDLLIMVGVMVFLYLVMKSNANG